MENRELSEDIQAQHFEHVFLRTDPWNYGSEYEQRKYRHTLEMIPERAYRSALELGCAEGLFTQQLAARVERLTSVDISERALARARARLGDRMNVSFERRNISASLPEGPFDLVVCSEILYYLKNRSALRRIARQLTRILSEDGYLLMAHANAVADDKSHTGFDFNEIGAQFIGTVFARRNELEFVRELRTSLYRVQVFRKSSAREWAAMVPREVITRSDAVDVAGTPSAAPFTGAKRGGVLVSRAEARHCWTSPQIPILMYHRVAVDGPEILAPYRISPGKFELQLAYLQRHGYESVGIEKAYALLNDTRPPAGKFVVFTFDDAYMDFAEVAWPLLRAYGFTATVFVPTGFVGKSAEWDAQHGPTPPLMSWDDMRRLADEGIVFGGHGHTHSRLTSIPDEEVIAEASTSRATLESQLQRKTTLFCYPYNARNERVIAAVGSCGYEFAVGAGGLCGAGRHQLDLPRQEILGTDSMDAFIQQLGQPEKAPLSRRLRYLYLRATRDRRTYLAY